MVIAYWFHGVVRFVLRDVLLNLHSTQHKQKIRVAIYGAGVAGAQLAAALRLAGNTKIVTFVDSDPAYWSRSINGVGIQPPEVLNQLDDSIDQVLLAIPLFPAANVAVSSMASIVAAFAFYRCLR